MRVLLCTIGSRGDVQPLVALALELRALGQEVRACVPPDFRDWLEGLGIAVLPMGPQVRQAAPGSLQEAQDRPEPEMDRQGLEVMISGQFATISAAAQGCDVIVAVGAQQIAARSVAEQIGIPYVYATYCPVTLPSRHHAPPPMGEQAPAHETADNRTLWARDARCWNQVIGAAVNSHRISCGLAPVTDVQSHVFTARPWLAADPALGPWPEPADLDATQTGAWILPDQRPLPSELVRFLQAGEPPIYFGFGSMLVPRDLGQVLVKSARELGRRVVVSRGWADLFPQADEPDCLFIGEVNHQALFTRVAAVVHHGGAGTTTTTARAGVPQVVIPQRYDQHYWAERIQLLGIGAAHPPTVPTADSLATALGHALRPGIAARARAIAAEVRTTGARSAAQLLIAQDF